LPDAVYELAQKAVEETGFDPRTGQILNSAQFQKWKQQKADPNAAAGSATNTSLMESFRKGRVAVESWVDEDTRQALVLRGEMSALQADPEMAAIFADSAKFGPAMVQKLQAHLAFMVENRRKYYAAYHAQFGSSPRHDLLLDEVAKGGAARRIVSTSRGCVGTNLVTIGGCGLTPRCAQASR